MGTIIDYEVTGEPLLLTGTPGTTDMTFKQLRQLTQGIQRAGVLDAGHLAVTNGAAGVVAVAAGYVWVDGTVDTGYAGQFRYGLPVTAGFDLTGIPSPSGATRRDIVVARVYDEGDAPGNGGLNEGRIQYIANASETLTAESTPANSELIAWVDITTGGVKTITDKRRWAKGVATVAVLPTNPADGQVINYQTAGMLTDGALWELRYNAGSAFAQKWECIGGTPWAAVVDTDESITSTSFVDLATVGPTITSPLAGEFEVKAGFQTKNNTATVTVAYGQLYNGSGMVGYELIATLAGSQYAYDVERAQKLTLVAGTSYKIRHKTTAGVQTFFKNRRLSIMPIRVG